ncbi:MAG: molybdenum cofactor guanylyltransferase [Gemmatimonadota bacterium]
MHGILTDGTPGALTYGAILAGGRSVRFGSPKAFARVGGLPLIERVLRCHRVALPESVIVTNEPSVYAALGASVICDLHPHSGPLAGLHAALIWASEKGVAGVCCTPCDAPFVHPELLRRLALASVGMEAVLPRSDGPLGYEPQFGWYSVAVLPVVAACLSTGHLAFWQLVEQLGTIGYISTAEVREFTSPALVFSNVNTLDDLAIAQKQAELVDDAG